MRQNEWPFRFFGFRYSNLFRISCFGFRISLHVRHLERLPLDRLGDQPAADGADGDADRLDRAVDLDLHPLEVRLEPPLGDAGHLPADAAEVLGLAAAADLIAPDGLLARDRALHAHDYCPPPGRDHYSDRRHPDKARVAWRRDPSGARGSAQSALPSLRSGRGATDGDLP